MSRPSAAAAAEVDVLPRCGSSSACRGQVPCSLMISHVAGKDTSRHHLTMHKRGGAPARAAWTGPIAWVTLLGRHRSGGCRCDVSHGCDSYGACARRQCGRRVRAGHRGPELARTGQAARAAARAATGTKTVEYGGYAIDVPAGWPVYLLAAQPWRCVRYDRHAVYLGLRDRTSSAPRTWWGGQTRCGSTAASFACQPRESPTSGASARSAG